jgi:hypothetical protein
MKKQDEQIAAQNLEQAIKLLLYTPNQDNLERVLSNDCTIHAIVSTGLGNPENMKIREELYSAIGTATHWGQLYDSFKAAPVAAEVKIHEHYNKNLSYEQGHLHIPSWMWNHTEYVLRCKERLSVLHYYNA